MKLIFNTYGCWYVSFLSFKQHNRWAVCTLVKSSHTSQSFRNLTTPSSIFLRPKWESWYLMLWYLTLHKCAIFTQNAAWAATGTVNIKSALGMFVFCHLLRSAICQAACHFDMNKTGCYQQKSPALTASKRENHTLACAIGCYDRRLSKWRAEERNWAFPRYHTVFGR